MLGCSSYYRNLAPVSTAVRITLILTRLTVILSSAFHEAPSFHLPSVPVLFEQDAKALMEGAETKFLIAVLCEYVTNNYLEPKYASATPLDEQALSEISLHDMIWG